MASDNGKEPTRKVKIEFTISEVDYQRLFDTANAKGLTVSRYLRNFLIEKFKLETKNQKTVYKLNLLSPEEYKLPDKERRRLYMNRKNALIKKFLTMYEDGGGTFNIEKFIAQNSK